MWSLFSAHGRERDVEDCLVMGIVNATPDSFSDGGRLAAAPEQTAYLRALIDAGADILDVGGESTRPGHEVVPVEEEIARVVPIIEAIRELGDIWISIDTSKAEVAEAAIAAGADFVNDVSGLADHRLARLVAGKGCSVVAMRSDDCIGDIVGATRDQLRMIAVRARASGISDPQIILDPGLGFGERPGAHVADNLALIDHIGDYAMGRPVLIGASRKRFVGAWKDIPDPMQRDAASIELARRARAAGAAIVRVHDVAGTAAALRVDVAG